MSNYPDDIRNFDDDPRSPFHNEDDDHAYDIDEAADVAWDKIRDERAEDAYDKRLNPDYQEEQLTLDLEDNK